MNNETILRVWNIRLKNRRVQCALLPDGSVLLCYKKLEGKKIFKTELILTEEAAIATSTLINKVFNDTKL